MRAGRSSTVGQDILHAGCGVVHFEENAQGFASDIRCGVREEETLLLSQLTVCVALQQCLHGRRQRDTAGASGLPTWHDEGCRRGGGEEMNSGPRRLSVSREGFYADREIDREAATAK